MHGQGWHLGAEMLARLWRHFPYAWRQAVLPDTSRWYAIFANCSVLFDGNRVLRTGASNGPPGGRCAGRGSQLGTPWNHAKGTRSIAAAADSRGTSSVASAGRPCSIVTGDCYWRVECFAVFSRPQAGHGGWSCRDRVNTEPIVPRESRVVRTCPRPCGCGGVATIRDVPVPDSVAVVTAIAPSSERCATSATWFGSGCVILSLRTGT